MKSGSLITVVDESAAGLTVPGSKFGLTRSADLQLWAGDITICPVSVPACMAFGLPAKGCVMKNVTGTADFGPWNVNPEYNVYWWATVGNADANGGTYSITALGGGFSATVTNEDASDRYPGTWMYVALPAGGWYEVCQTVAPTGGQLADPSCKQVLVEYGISNFVPAFQSDPL